MPFLSLSAHIGQKIKYYIKKISRNDRKSKGFIILLPALAIILGCWLTVACTLTVVFRPNRQAFVTELFITWWDLGKSIAAFWGGIFKFVFNLFITLLSALKVAVLGIWALIQEVLLMPLRLLGNAGRGVVGSTVPWIAVCLTLFWCLLEAVIFTYVTTPLVVDTFSNITGDNLSITMVRIMLFVFLLVVVLGSYAVLSTFVDSFKQKSISTIIGIGVVEIVVLFVEVVFLYREFVDALVPWFAQYSENFELGIFWTLAIAAFVWFGIRSLSWFLFAAHGTPTIMAVIQGKGLALAERRESAPLPRSPLSTNFMNKIKEDMIWIQKAGDDLLASFILPPLQVIAAAINFCTLLVSGKHLFELPIKSIPDAIQIRTRERPEPEIVNENRTTRNESLTHIK
ncbi:hypothetical protein IH785_18465 [candidate division KSB1 bacterium]|nr:hypothetical protein [candidate division KSB1 bacterium]